MADTYYLNEKMAAVITEATHVSLHTADPNGVGENEVSGGNPPYARLAIASWAAGSVDGSYEATVPGAFNVPPDTEVTWAGLWNGTQYLDKAPCFMATINQDTAPVVQLIFSLTTAE